MTLLYETQLPEKRTFPWHSEFFTKPKTLPIIELEGIIISEETGWGELGVKEKSQHEELQP